MKAMNEGDVSSAWGTVREVAKRISTSTKTVWRMVDEGKLPKPAALSKRCLRFNLREVDACMEKAKL